MHAATHHGTDFVGHIEVRPPLNATEAAYVDELARRLPGTPAPRPSPWTCTDGGARLVVGEGEDSEHLAVSLRRLIKECLGVGAHLRAHSDRAPYDEFAFDHVLDGMVVGCRRVSGDLFAIAVKENRVTRRMLRARDGSGRPPGQAPAPPPAVAAVIDLATRRQVGS